MCGIAESWPSISLIDWKLKEPKMPQKALSGWQRNRWREKLQEIRPQKRFQSILSPKLRRITIKSKKEQEKDLQVSYNNISRQLLIFRKKDPMIMVFKCTLKHALIFFWLKQKLRLTNGFAFSNLSFKWNMKGCLTVR